jgi:glycosyltransferase involved in cell wall biosynthesis
LAGSNSTKAMKDKVIFFVSTVREWGGSEVLWAETASSMLDNGYKVIFATRYTASIVSKLKGRGATHVNIGASGIIDRVLQKIKLRRHPFLKALGLERPKLVVISTGSNTDARIYMNLCGQGNTPYLSIVHLVTNILWPFLDDKTIDELRLGYAKARINYFVSKANLELHNLMIGDQQPNCRALVNPFPVPKEVPENYPPLINGNYQVALVGRIEMFHKGHDILIQVLNQPKWKERAIVFNLYGSGPHVELLQRLLLANEIKNVVLKGYVQGIAEVWKNNHLLILPSRMEGQSLALLEAMWCKRAALVTNVGGASELIIDGETGFMSAFPTVLHVDQTLEKAWSMREQWEQLGQNAGRKIREVYNDHSVEDFASDMKLVFDEVTMS